MIELGNDKHGHLISKSTNSVYSPGVETVISRSENGELYGGVIFSCYCRTSVCMDVAGFRPNWLNRNLLWLVFTYAFGQLKCNVVIGRVWSTNAKAVKFDTHIGFQEVFRIKDAVPNGDLVLMTMYKDQCKWLKLRPKNLQVWDHLRKAA